MRGTVDVAMYDLNDNETVYRVTCKLTPETPDVPYLRNGDPGHPGDPGECEIEKVTLKGVEIKDWDHLGFDMEKIEELYLHLIEMDKQMTTLKSDNTALKEKIEQLEHRN